MKHKKHKKTIRKKLYKPKNKSMKKTGGAPGGAPGDGAEQVLTDSDFITRKDHREDFMLLFNEIKELKQIIDNNKNIEDLYKILRANNIEAYNFNDPRRAKMDTLMQNDYKRFRWHRLCMLRTFVGISEWVMENRKERAGFLHKRFMQKGHGTGRQTMQPPSRGERAISVGSGYTDHRQEGMKNDGGEFFNAVYGTFPAYIFTKKHYTSTAAHPDVLAGVHRYFDYNKKNSDCCLYDEDTEGLERANPNLRRNAERKEAQSGFLKHHIPYNYLGEMKGKWLHVYLRTSEDRGDGRTGLAEEAGEWREGSGVRVDVHHTHPLNFSSYKMF